MRLPKGRKDTRTHLVNVTAQYRARHDPCQTQFRISKQRRFINYDPTQLNTVMEVYRPEMKIPESAVSGGATKSGLQFVKASTLQPPGTIGETVEFTIQGDVEVSHVGEGQTARDLYSVPVGYVRAGQKNQGQYSINKTALKILVSKLGDETTAWTGARFTGFVSPTRNPQTGGQTTTFAILADSVKSAKTR